MNRRLPAAVFFDVDFTLIYPGPTFQGEGYERFAAAHGIMVDPSRFDAAVRAASSILDSAQEHIYDPAIFVRYTRRIIEGMGGAGETIDACAREIYDEWAECHHFFLYEDVGAVLRDLDTSGVRIGLISNSHRCLEAFEEHFELNGLISGAISSSDHGYMKPHPSIFAAALEKVGVTAGESVMVGDSLSHDIEGALRAGMRGVLVQRSNEAPPALSTGVPVIRDLSELMRVL